MTLVVARRHEGRIYMVGDTRYAPEVTGGRDGQRHFIGALKIVILHPGLVIAFANNGPNAQRAIEGIHSHGLNLLDKNAVLNYFLEHHRQSLQGGPEAMVEFIAAFVLGEQTSELFIIKSGDVAHVDAGSSETLSHTTIFCIKSVKSRPRRTPRHRSVLLWRLSAP